MTTATTHAIFSRVILPTREAWLARRRSGLGASDAAAILGLSRRGTPLSVYADKLGLVPEQPPTERMRLGIRLEPVVADLFSDTTGIEILPAEPFTLSIRRGLPWLIASLDREIVDPVKGTGVLELKTAASDQAEFWADEPPLEYQIQVQHQLVVTGYTWGAIALLLGGAEFKVFYIERHDRLCRLLVARLGEFWEKVQDKAQPSPRPAEIDRDVLAALYPEPRGPVIPLGPEYVEWDAKREDADAQLKFYREQKLEAENFLKAAIGDAAGGVLPNGTVYSWKTVNRRSYMVEPTSYRELRRRERRA